MKEGGEGKWTFAMAIVGTAMIIDEATRQRIAKNLGLEMIEPDNSDSDKQE